MIHLAHIILHTMAIIVGTTHSIMVGMTHIILDGMIHTEPGEILTVDILRLYMVVIIMEITHTQIIITQELTILMEHK